MKVPVLAATAALMTLIAGTASAQQGADSMARRHMAEVQQMRATQDSTDARLERLVQKMNGSKGDKKVQAIADVINELMAERRTMREHMRRMMQQPGMGAGMNPHGQMPRGTPMQGPPRQTTPSKTGTDSTKK